MTQIKPRAPLSRERGRAPAEDLLILCSDGLTTMLTDDEIADLLVKGGTKREMTERLVNAANELGGVDNITVVLMTA